MEARPHTESVFRWLLATGCFALLIFFFSPPWATYDLWARVPEMGVLIEVRRAVSVLFQVEHPGAEIPDPLHGAIQWRLLFPVLGRVLHLPAPLLFGLAHAGCLAVLYFIVAVLRRNGLGWVHCGLAAVILGAGSWFFTSVSWLGYFDSWMVLGLLIVAFSESRWSLWAACVWAPWVDERFVMAVPLALLCRHLYGLHRGRPSDVKREFGLALALVLAFVCIRLGVLASRTGTTATIGGYFGKFTDFEAPWSRRAFGLWTGLRVAWLFVALGLLALWRTNRAHATILAAAVAVMAVLGLATAQDLSRSMMFLAPAALLGAVGRNGPNLRWLAALTAFALLLPAHHVMTNRVNPIYYLHHELGAFHRPPPEAMPELLELQAIRSMEQGELVAAAETLSLAIKLARNPAGPSRQRGILFATQQQWAAARNDFSTVVRHEPQNPDGWFLRAQAALALGDPSAAEADFKQALAVAPAKWSERPDVVRFLARLQPQGDARQGAPRR